MVWTSRHDIDHVPASYVVTPLGPSVQKRVGRCSRQMPAINIPTPSTTIPAPPIMPWTYSPPLPRKGQNGCATDRHSCPCNRKGKGACSGRMKVHGRSGIESWSRTGKDEKHPNKKHRPEKCRQAPHDSGCADIRIQRQPNRPDRHDPASRQYKERFQLIHLKTPRRFEAWPSSASVPAHQGFAIRRFKTVAALLYACTKPSCRTKAGRRLHDVLSSE